MADNYRFAESDSLLCYHGPMLYEAKCLQRRKTSDGKAQYFIHYKGWNSKWEEWVDDNRVLTVNAANMNKMASLKEIHSNSKKSGTKRSITVVKEETTRTTTPPVKGRKRKYSELSTESNSTVNVPSPSEPKQKKRVGRPPKISLTPKIEETGVTEEVKATETVRSTSAEAIVVDEVQKYENVENTERIEVDEEIKSTEAIAETEIPETTEITETTESSSTDAVFIVPPAPLPKTLYIPIIDIPPNITKRIAYDYQRIKFFKEILKFPKEFTIYRIIHDYISSKVDNDDDKEGAINIGLTLIQYFNILIHEQLLHQNEHQFNLRKKAQRYLITKLEEQKITKVFMLKKLYPKRLWHYVYGPTHLIRLFVHLPILLSTCDYTELQFNLIVKYIQDFLEYLESNFNLYFTKQYFKPNIDRMKKQNQ